MDSQEVLINEIKSLSDSIRKKNQALRSNISERDAFVESTFKPIITPLKEISKTLNRADIERAALLPVSKRQDITDEKEEEDNEYDEDSNTVQGLVKDENIDEETLDTEEMSIDGSTEEEEREGMKQPLPLTRLSEIGLEMSAKGPLTRKYILKMLNSNQPKRMFHSYGARLDSEGIMVGNRKVTTDGEDNIIIGDRKFPGSKGLFELLFTKQPKSYTKRDLSVFKLISNLTNAHKKQYNSNSPVHRNTSVLYTQIVSKLFPRKILKTTTGKGLKSVYDTNIIYYKDINKLVERLRLLYEAQEAGHTGVGNEIVSLVDELRRRGYIK